MWENEISGIMNGDFKVLSRCISLVENEAEGYEALLESLPVLHTPIIGITGPPGAGKSTLTSALIEVYTNNNKKVAVLCIDPSSPFNLGALLGDRIRMNNWYNSPNVFIRSLATRGSLGGLNPKIVEITSLLGASFFDYIIIETVGVGQSEIEIAGLADVTVVVIVPEAGDEVQTMKAGLMEIADIFVVNKADRPDADLFVKNLNQMLAPAFSNHAESVPVLKTIASEKMGVEELAEAIRDNLSAHVNEKRSWLQAEKAYQLIQRKRMDTVTKKALKEAIEGEGKGFNLYKFVKKYF